MAAAYEAITSNAAEGGVSDFPYPTAVPSLTGYQGERPHDGIQEEAISYKYGIAAIGLSFVETLIRRRVLELTTDAINKGIGQTFNANANAAPGTAHATASNIAEALGLWQIDAGNQAPIRECIADVMFNNISGLNREGNDARTRFENASGQVSRTIATKTPVNNAENYASLRVHAMNLMVQGISGSWDSAQSRKVGRALNASAPQDDLHCLFGHFC
jgi:hypothetical protein